MQIVYQFQHVRAAISSNHTVITTTARHICLSALLSFDNIFSKQQFTMHLIYLYKYNS